MPIKSGQTEATFKERDRTQWEEVSGQVTESKTEDRENASRAKREAASMSDAEKAAAKQKLDEALGR